MEQCQVVSLVILSFLSFSVQISYQHQKFNVFTVDKPIRIEEPRRFRKMNDRPAMAPNEQVGKPVELMSQEEYKVTKLRREELKNQFGGRTVEQVPELLRVTDEVFFEVEIDNFEDTGEALRRNITIACFGGLTPVTCLNFVSITKGFRKGKNRLSYKNGAVSKVVRDFMIQMGDTSGGSNESIFGKNFADESFAISHNHAGWVGMANFGKDSNGSQFYVLLRTARWLDGKHVIFGKVVSGMDFIQTIGEQDTNQRNAPIKSIRIVNCGSLNLKKPYILTQSQFSTDGDIERAQVEEDEL